MTSGFVPRIRIHQPADDAAVFSVVEQAFESRVEAELVRLILASPGAEPDLSLVAEHETGLIGHVMLSRVELDDEGARHRVLSLSPLSVHPAHQNRGIGSALVRAALACAQERGEPLVCLEGSPRYYGRLGFEDARSYRITFDLPDWAPPDAGQICRLRAYDPAVKGHVIYPPAFAEVETMRARLES